MGGETSRWAWAWGGAGVRAGVGKVRRPETGGRPALGSSRQMVARSIQETLRAVVGVPEDVHTVLEIMNSLSSNDGVGEAVSDTPVSWDLLEEAAVRTELMEQVPQIAVLCHEYPEHLGGVVANNLVPMVVKYLTDPNNQVRKTSQAALLVLLEQELVSRSDVHDQVCPVILDLTCPDAMDDFKTEAVALMSKMAPLIGREMTERLFLERFTRLCSDALFQVRKVCASNFGDFCSVVGTQPTEEVLVSRFVFLCEDGVWGVRKACAEVFMGVSCACSLPTRKNKLSPLFVSLLTDQSRWVRVAAFQNLGPFISTFADAAVTGLHYNEEGALVIGTPQGPAVHAQELNADTVVVSGRGDDEAQHDAPPAQQEHSSLQSPEPPQEEDDPRAAQESPFESQHHDKCEPDVCDGGGGGRVPDFNAQVEPMEVEELPDMIQDLQPPDGGHEQSAEERRARAYIFSSVESNAEPKEELATAAATATRGSAASDPPDRIDDASRASSAKGEVAPSAAVPVPPNSLPGAMEGGASPSNSLTVSGTEGHLHVHLDNNPAFNTFNYWRTPIMPIELPIPQIEVDIDIMGQTTNVCVKAKVQENDGTYQSQVNLTMATNTGAPNITLAPTPQDKQAGDRPPGTTIESSTVVSVSGPQQATYAQVCAASVTSVQHKSEPQPSILASRLAQARVSMSGGAVTEIKKREMDVVSPSDCGTSASSTGPSLPPQPPVLSQRLVDQFTVMLPGSSDQVSGMAEHSSGSAEFTNLNQDIVPKTLLEHYISMTDPMRAETVDNELTRHCAYSLPAVALTLGRQNWPVLKDTYETLAGDMHWKVRRTLAFSIHELAVILGEEIAQNDLVPVFNGFIKDLDEVRIGVLKHLAHFLRLLRPQNRRDYLPRMDEFLRTDNENNWRFRLELATQLADIIDLFSPQDCQTFLVPITLALMADKVVHIRRTCYTVVCQLVRQLGCEGDQKYVEAISEQLKVRFAYASTWSQRQSYAFLCGRLVAEQALPLPDWCRLFLPNLILLASDRVPNVRIAVAKMLATHIACLEYCQNPENEATHKIQKTLEQLRNDKDRDVGHFASYPVNTEIYVDPQDPTL
ncbi:serine/threonine-protein phosphatase 4 regulatory subunit 1-like isoform X3 [Penaeus chinensis]|uniref:serine/threonine-protein phosphatase 4 regulatory subunit 1-like isoform X3 n=1 Tax=Penaeus chinensis TaxID=139456 RepID=UPI001FB57094|nr:serine/threonine-protein phosphatase 4 regulatory subunit 1-like isoform X3 [Penaeus chinensis]